MADIFLKIVNMSISASWIVLAVLVLRLLLKKAPKWITVLLWGIVAIRLICPFSIESVMSLIPSTETISPEIMMDKTPTINSGVPIINNIVNPVIGESFAPDPIASANPLQILIPVLAIAWIVGIVIMLAYTAISYFRVKSKIGTAVLFRDNIYQSENVISPFVLGIIKPKIYLPFNMNEQDMEHVIAHENAHIHRKDHLWKPFGFLVLTLHWFNPLMWLGYVLLCRDIELACDEKVVKEFNNEQKADYSQALLTCSVNRRVIAACPLAFGEVGVKNRVKSVLNYKKPAFWIIVVAIIASAVVAICFLTDPQSELNVVKNQKSGSELDGLSLKIVSIETSAPDPYITIQYKNGTSNDLIYGDEHYIYQKVNDSWEDCRVDTTSVWDLVGYYMIPGATYEHIYGLNGKIMSQPGIYRFETEFSVEGKSETKYKVWIEFELTAGVDGITVHTFDPVALVYDDGRYSFVQTVENAPRYRIANAMQLQEIDSDGNVTMTCNLERIKLNNDNFDTRFMGGSECWLGDETLQSLKDNNKRAWQQTVSDGDNHLLYLLIEQNDGTFYLGYGYYGTAGENTHNPDDSHIRWLYRLAYGSISNVGGADGPDNITVNSNDSTGIHYPNNQGLYEVTPTDEIQSKYDNEEFVIQKLHYKSNDGTWVCENYVYKYRLEISGRLNNAEKNTTYIVLSNSKDITFEQTWKASGLSSLMSDYFNPKDAVIVGHRLFSTTSTKGNLETAISSVLNEKYNKAGKPDGLIHIETYNLLASSTASGTPIKGNSGHMEIANVYLLVYHMKYSVNGGQLEEVEGDFVPTAITFAIDKNGRYNLEEYWTPQTGANYEKDVRSKFPGEAADNVLNTEKYAEELIKESWRLANQYLNQIKN